MIPFTKKQQIAEQIHRLLDGGAPSSDTNFDPREIMIFVDQALAYFVKIAIFEGIKNGDVDVPEPYTVTFSSVTVQKDENLLLNYVDIPALYLNLPKNGGLKGIRAQVSEFPKSLSPTVPVINSFIPIGNGGLNFVQAHKGPFLQGNVGFWGEGNRAYFDQDLDKLGIKKIILQLITTSSEAINISLDLEQQVIQYVYNIMSPKIPQDDLSNTNPMKRQV